MSDGRIDLSISGTVATLTINNPKKLNAVSVSMWRQLDDALAQVGEEVRCIVVQGYDKAFASGADISEFGDQRGSAEANAAYDSAAGSAMTRLYSMPQPTVAKISGYCFGGGMGIALCCDIRLASETSQFCIPAARLGLGYGWTGIKKLLDVVSVPVATEILVTARRYPAAEALTMGLVNRLYASDALDAAVAEYAQTISQNAPLTIRAAKQTIKELSRLGSTDFALCERLVSDCFNSDDYREGAKAFLEKRSPQFAGH
ncbi:MAG TPA: enoyl-CoA hydratase [Caulobacteraceae bacterium]|nr:enoyl-CoA hydratase [Caulobacteraceae bacterium]